MSNIFNAVSKLIYFGFLILCQQHELGQEGSKPPDWNIPYVKGGSSKGSDGSPWCQELHGQIDQPKQCFPMCTCKELVYFAIESSYQKFLEKSHQVRMKNKTMNVHEFELARH